jgi:hypothetical protein
MTKEDFINQTKDLKHGKYYWVLLEGYNEPTPCYFYKSNYEPERSCFLPGGLGDTSSMGVFLDDIKKILPEIIVPIF